MVNVTSTIAGVTSSIDHTSAACTHTGTLATETVHEYGIRSRTRRCFACTGRPSRRSPFIKQDVELAACHRRTTSSGDCGHVLAVLSADRTVLREDDPPARRKFHPDEI